MIISTNCVSLVSAVTTVPASDAVAEHGDAVGDLAHLVEVVRDEEDRCARRRSVAHEREEPLDALPRQEDRRLVEDEQARGRAPSPRGSPRSRGRSRAAPARPASGRRRAPTGRGGRRSASNVSRARARSRAPGDAEARARRRELGDAQVLEHAQRLDEPEILVDEAHPESRGTARSRAAAAPARRRSSSSPPSGSWKPASILISVDLPEPFSPRRPWTSPGSTSRSTRAQRLRAAEALRQVAQVEARPLASGHRYLIPQSFL